MRRYRTTVVAVATALFIALMAGPVSAATAVLTYGSQGGTAVPVGDVITGSGTALFRSSFGGSTVIKCSVLVTQTVTSNPPAPGSATGTISFSFSSCTVNLTGVTGIKNVSFNNQPYTITFDSSGTVTISPGGTGPIQLTVVLSTLLGTVTCIHQPGSQTIIGTLSNSTGLVTVTEAPLNKVSGPSVCPATLYMDLTYGPVVGPGGTVYLN